MALIKYQVLDCKTNTHPKCTGTFKREVKRGKVPTSCTLCKAVVKPVNTSEPTELASTCPCGNTFTFMSGGRGRKREKCDECRDSGVMYRQNSDGGYDAKTLADQQAEERERAEAIGLERAMALIERMKLLHLKTNRTVIHH
jgi:hypothetical protein